jgi:hypothetical protein
VKEAFNDVVTFALKNDTYLKPGDGKRRFFEEFVLLGKNGFCATGWPFVSKDTSEIRFYGQYPSGLKVDRRFKVADMIYQGGLEY